MSRKSDIFCFLKKNFKSSSKLQITFFSLLMMFWISFYNSAAAGSSKKGPNQILEFVFLISFWLITSIFTIFEKISVMANPMFQPHSTLLYFVNFVWTAFLIIYFYCLFRKMRNAFRTVNNEKNEINQMRLTIFSMFSTSVILIWFVS